MTAHAPHGSAPGHVKAPSAPPSDRRRWLPSDWTHLDTIALESAHETINNYSSLFSAEFAQLLKDPEKNAERIAKIQANDLDIEKDRDRLASLDRAEIAAITKKYDGLLGVARIYEGQPST